jgi:hypothetical protein
MLSELGLTATRPKKVVENVGRKAFLLFSGQGTFKRHQIKPDAIDTITALTQDDRARRSKMSDWQKAWRTHRQPRYRVCRHPA